MLAHMDIIQMLYTYTATTELKFGVLHIWGTRILLLLTELDFGVMHIWGMFMHSVQ